MSIPTLVAAYAKTRADWYAAWPSGEYEPEGPEWDAYVAAEVAIFEYPCRTIEDVRAKARAILGDQSLSETIHMCRIGEVPAAEVFLRSVLGEDGARASILADLIQAHSEAIAEFDRTSDEEWETQGDRIGPLVDRTRDAILDHRPASLEEVAIKATYMAADRTFHEWEDFDHIKLITAFLPVEGDARS